MPAGEIILPPVVMPGPANLGIPKVEMIQNPSSEIDWDASVPASPELLGEGWEETTHPNNNSGSKDFKNKKTGEEIRWDPGKEGKPGWEGKDHWHRYNPNSTGKKDLYLDRSGNAVSRGSEASHIGTPLSLPPVIILDKKGDNRNFLQKAWDTVKYFFKPSPEDNPYMI
jgi:hypothetical protein